MADVMTENEIVLYVTFNTLDFIYSAFLCIFSSLASLGLRVQNNRGIVTPRVLKIS
jgi:hypothetical protein